MLIHFPAVAGCFQRIGKLQQGIHFCRVKLVGCFQVTVNLCQPLQLVHIHNLRAVPLCQFCRMIQQVFIQLFHKLLLCFNFDNAHLFSFWDFLQRLVG